MNNFFKDNPLGTGLSIACGVLLLLLLVVPLALGHLSLDVEAEAEDEQAQASAGIPNLDLAKVSEYEVINNKHLFAENRQPIPKGAVQEEGPAQQAAPEQPNIPLEAEVAGVIITPERKIAMLRNTQDSSIVSAEEGQWLQEIRGGWRVGEIAPRRVVFNRANGRTEERELEVHTTAIKAAPKPEPRQRDEQPADATEPVAQAEGEAAENDENSAEVNPSTAYQRRAEEIRRRIAERREEVRRQQQEAENNENQ